MSDEITSALHEIAGLLRQRVEQSERQLEFQSESRQSLDQIRDAAKDRETVSILTQQAEVRRQADKSLAEMRERERQKREEEKLFRERLLAQLERHNRVVEQQSAVLERLLEHLHS